MSLYDTANYLLFTNPISSSVISVLSHTAEKAGIKAPPKTSPNLKKIMQNPIPLWRLAGNHYHIIRLAGVSGCAAVILGAYGAHRKFRPFDEPEERADLRAIFDTANKYHLLHSVALLAVPMTRNPVITATFFTVGITLFCGSCYYRSITDKTLFNRAAPLGGVFLILGWLSLLF